MAIKRSRRVNGFTLVEVAIAIVVLLITTIGAMGYRYQCAISAKTADEQNTAARVASMLLDNWKGVGSGTGYDPVVMLSSDLTIATGTNGPATPSGFIHLGNYQITANQATYYATFSYLDETATMPRQLNVAVMWMRDKQSFSTSSGVSHVVSLTTYAD